MGGNDSTSNSRPLTADERAAAYNAGISSMGNTLGSGYLNNGSLNTSGLTYQTPTYQSLGDGDYDAYQKSIYDSTANNLDTTWKNRSADINQSMADRGLWSSGVAEQVLNDDYNENWLPQYTQAANNAATTRYQLQAQDLANQNTFNTNQAEQEYNSKWRPLDYAQGLYNGTGGVISSSNSTGWSI
jgi:hypothetical protein